MFFTRFLALRHFFFWHHLYRATVIDVQFVFITFMWNVLHFPFSVCFSSLLAHYFVSFHFVTLIYGNARKVVGKFNRLPVETHPAGATIVPKEKLNFWSRWKIKWNKVQHWQSFNKFMIKTSSDFLTVFLHFSTFPTGDN